VPEEARVGRARQNLVILAKAKVGVGDTMVSGTIHSSSSRHSASRVGIGQNGNAHRNPIKSRLLYLLGLRLPISVSSSDI
jgi:hypothetical protein